MEELFGIEYSCYSQLSEDDESKYVTEINGSIIVFDENDRLLEVAGKFSLSVLNLLLASEDGFYLPYVFDSAEHIMNIGECMYDFEKEYFIRNLKEGFDDDIYGENMLVFHYIEIAAKYRGRNLSAMVFKDVINRFGQNCAFLAMCVFSLQHSRQDPVNEDEKEWMEKLKLNELEQDEEQAFYKLAAHFQSMGFVNISDDVFALNLSKINPLDDMRLQEMV